MSASTKAGAKKKGGKSKAGHKGARAKRGQKKKRKERKKKTMSLLEQIEADLMVSQAMDKEAEIRSMFNKYDKNHDRCLDKDELRALLIDMGFQADLGANFDLFLEEEFKLRDQDSNNSIDFEEFVELHNWLTDEKMDVRHFNSAIQEITSTSGWTAQEYHQNLHRLAAAHKAIETISSKIVETLDAVGDVPRPALLQIFNAILILFDLPHSSTPEQDWTTAKQLFDGPHFVDDLKAFDVSKLRRRHVKEVTKCISSLIPSFSALAKTDPMSHTLLSWVMTTVAQAQAQNDLDAPPPGSEVDPRPNDLLQRFKFGRGSTAAKGVWRLRNTDIFVGNFHRKRERSSQGVTLQLGTVELSGKTEIAAIWFDRAIFSEEQAASWWEDHKSAYQVNPEDTGASAEEKQVNSKNYTEQWGYDEKGNFVKQRVYAQAADDVEAEVRAELMSRARSGLEKFATDDIVCLVQEVTPPPKCEVIVRLVARLLENRDLEGWEACKAFLGEADILEKLRSFDVCTISRKEMRARMSKCSPFLLDPDLSASGMKSANSVAFGLVIWVRGVISAADDPTAVSAGRKIDEDT